MDLLTVGVPSDDHDVVRRLAAGDPDLTRFMLHPMAGRRRIVCPPALTPLVRRWESAYLGLWRHPVVAGRSVSFVEYVWETARVREVATSAPQLVAWLFVGLLDVVDEPATDPRWGALTRAASALGIADLRELYDLTMEGFVSLYALPAFAAGPPRDADVMLPLAGYRGEFPVKDGDPSVAHRTAGCEYPVGSVAAGARWLGGGSPVDRFADLMNAGDLAGAWLALNTPGWPFSDAARSLGRITAAAADDAALGLLADDWNEHTDPVSGGY